MSPALRELLLAEFNRIRTSDPEALRHAHGRCQQVSGCHCEGRMHWLVAWQQLGRDLGIIPEW